MFLGENELNNRLSTKKTQPHDFSSTMVAAGI
jgi:hypothetical protein